MVNMKFSFSVGVLAATVVFRVLMCAGFLGLLLRFGVKSLFLDSLAVVLLSGLSEIVFGYLLARLKLAAGMRVVAESATESALRKVVELIVLSEQRQGELQDALIKESPGIFEEQLHAQADTKERAYWHYGYLMALKDFVGALKRALGVS